MHTQLRQPLHDMHVETCIKVVAKFGNAPVGCLGEMHLQFVSHDTLRIEIRGRMQEQSCRRFEHLVDALKAFGRLLCQCQSDSVVATAAGLVSECRGRRHELDRETAGEFASFSPWRSANSRPTISVMSSSDAFFESGLTDRACQVASQRSSTVVATTWQGMPAGGISDRASSIEANVIENQQRWRRAKSTKRSKALIIDPKIRRKLEIEENTTDTGEINLRHVGPRFN